MVLNASRPRYPRRAGADGFPAHSHGRRHAITELERASYHRMNAGYRPANTWASLLFGGGGPTDLLRDADLRAGTLLINMNQLWEGVVRRATADAVAGPGGGIEPARDANALTVTVDGVTNRALRPDVLVRLPTEPATLIAVDAKYKRARTEAISSGDLHQLLTYATAYTAPTAATPSVTARTASAPTVATQTATTPPRAMVVHPSEAGWTHRLVRVTGPYGVLGEVLVVGAELSEPAHEYREPLRVHLEQFLRHRP